MTHEEFTGVTFNDFDLSRTRISRSSEFSDVNDTEIVLNMPHKSAYFISWETTDKIIVYAFRKPRSMRYVTGMRYL